MQRRMLLMILTQPHFGRQARNFPVFWNLLLENLSLVYTPELDDYIAALVQEAKATDKDNSFLQDELLDIRPLCMMFEHLTAMSDSSPKRGLQVVSYSIRPVGNVSCLVSATSWSAVLNKINNHGSLVSPGKEDYPDAGRKLFGAGFEARLKARAEKAKTLKA